MTGLPVCAVPRRPRTVALAAVVLAWMMSAPVPAADVLSRLEVARRGDSTLPSPAELIRQMQADPESPYSALVDRPRFTNEVGWIDLVDSLPGMPGEAAALSSLALDLGLTRARPTIDVPERTGFRDRFVAANATKAGVDPDIFWHMLDLGGFRHFARTAPIALALQELRRQINTVPESRHAMNGIDTSVLSRVMAARSLQQVTPYDLDYLSALTQHALIHRRSGEQAPDGAVLPPMPYRVARLAAAWRDAEGYLSSPPCRPDGTARAAGTDGIPCFVAATDRAVHAWYVTELRRQANLPAQHTKKSGVARLMAAVALLAPLLELAAMAEVVEATIADDLAFDGTLETTEAEAAEQRAANLTCRIED